MEINKISFFLFAAIFSILFPAITPCQSGNITGYVYDDTGKPVAGANIILIESGAGTSSDTNGFFILRNIEYGNYSLEVSFVGFKKEKFKAAFNKSFETLKITLEPNSIETEQIIVSASKYEQKVSDLTVSSAVIAPEIISQKNILQFDDVLRYVPGVNMELNQVSIRGSSGYSRGAGTRVLVAVDGIPIYTGISGEIAWQLIPVSDIKRIEVIKGPAGSIYGQTAIGGVINIITRKTTEKPLTYFSSSVGLYGNPYYPEWKWSRSTRTFYGIEIAHSDRIGKLGYTISLKKINNSGYKENGYSQNYSGYVKMDYDIDENNSVRFMTYYLNSDEGYFIYWKDSRNALIPDESNLGLYNKSNREFASIIYHHNFSNNFSGEFKSSYYRSRVNSYTGNTANFASDLLRNEFIGTMKLNPDWIFTSGAEVAYSFINSNIFGHPHFLTLSLYAQSEYRISEKINSVLGLRNDYINLTGVIDANALTPKAGLNFRLSDDLILRTSFATGFRAPTPAEAFISANGKGNFSAVNSPKLDYEKSLSYEIGVIYKPFTTLKFDAALFNTDYKNFLELTLTRDGTIQFVNLPKARIQGFELVASFNPRNGLPYLSLGYDYLWARDLTNNQFLKYRPRHTIYGSAGINLFPLEIRTDLRYWTKFEQMDFYLTEPPVNLIPDGKNQSDAFVVDLSVGINFDLGPNPLKVFINCKNIFNYNYVEFIGNLAPVRNVSVSLETYF